MLDSAAVSLNCFITFRLQFNTQYVANGKGSYNGVDYRWRKMQQRSSSLQLIRSCCCCCIIISITLATVASSASTAKGQHSAK